MRQDTKGEIKHGGGGAAAAADWRRWLPFRILYLRAQSVNVIGGGRADRQTERLLTRPHGPLLFLLRDVT